MYCVWPKSIEEGDPAKSMANSNYDQYLEDEILHADPLQLVSILYRAAKEATLAARSHLKRREIRERSAAITKASEIIAHLMLSVDRNAGSEIGHNLIELYAYMQTRLAEANAKQMDEPLAEVETLLSTLLDAWQNVQPKAVIAADAAGEYIPVSCSW
jgi:flagellar protein FliS